MEKEIHHIISNDSNGNMLEGGEKYQLHLPANIPASDFWSIIVYDSLTRLIIHNDQPWPSVFSNKTNLIYNNDGSVDVWFGPKQIKGKENNWLQTIPGDQWYMTFVFIIPLKHGLITAGGREKLKK